MLRKEYNLREWCSVRWVVVIENQFVRRIFTIIVLARDSGCQILCSLVDDNKMETGT